MYLVEEMINVRRQQQPVRAIESLGIRRGSPRLDVARLQMSRLVHVRYATGVLAQQNIGPEHALPSSCPNDLFAERRSGQRRFDHSRCF